MKTFCEIIISDFLPTIRALITQELINNYNLNQIEVAKKLGVTQPAISYYIRNIRGNKTDVMKTNEKLMDIVKKTASDIANGSDAPIEIQNICKFLKDESILTDKEKLKCCSLCRK